MKPWKVGRTYPVRTAPLGLPVLFFATGTAGLLGGIVQLALASPLITAGRLGTGAVLAAVHLFTLAGFSMLMMGALYQLLPVLLNCPPIRPGAAIGQWSVFALGVGFLAAGLASGDVPAIEVGAAGVIIGIGWFVVQASVRIMARSTWNLTAAYLATGLAYLAMTMAVGGLLVARMTIGWPSLNNILAVHIVLALGGWWGMTLVGASYRLWAMFGRPHREPRHWGLTWVLANVGLLALAVGFGENWLGVRVAGWIVLVAAGASFFWDLVPAGLGDRRSLADPALWSAAASASGLAAFWVLGTLALLTHQGRLWPAALAAYGLGWVGLTALGFLQKIVPFLVWLHRYAHARTGRKMPRLPEIWPPGRMYPPGVGHMLGAALVVGGILAGAPEWVRAGCAVSGLGWAVLGIQGVRAVRGPHPVPE